MSDDRSCGGAGETPVSDQRNASAEFFIRTDRLGSVEHLGHAASLGALITDKYSVSLIDPAVQDRVEAFLFAVKGAGVQKCRVHFPGAGGVFDDRPLRRQVSLEDSNAPVGTDGIVKGTDDVFLRDIDPVLFVGFLQPFRAAFIEAVRFELIQVLAQSLPCDGLRVQMKDIPDLFHDGRHAAGIVEELSRPLACGAKVEQIVRSSVQPVESIAVNGKTVFACDRRQMQERICASGDRGMYHDGVLQGIHCHDIRRSDTFFCQLYGPLAGTIRVLKKVRARRGQQGAAGQGKAHGFRHDLHRGRSADETACAAARAGIFLGPVQSRLIDLAALILRAVHSELLQCQKLRAGTHSPARDHNGRNIDARHTDQIAGHSFITAGNIYSSVKRGRIRMDLDHIGDHLAARE